MPKSADRLAYEAIVRNQATMRQVNALLTKEAKSVLALGNGMAQQELGGFYRSVVPGMIDRWGKVNATAAARYYDEQRLAWLKRNPSGFSRSDRQANFRAADKFAQRQLQIELYKAKIPPINATKLAEPIIGHGMQTFVSSGFEHSATAVENALTRAVASYNRDTMLYNSALDNVVVSVQRVAEANACEFCQMLAFRSDRQYVTGASNIRTADYAIEFHNNCHCSIETLYEGDSPIVPDYYKDFTYGGSTGQGYAVDFQTK